MRYQDQVIRMTEKALDDVFRSARAMPKVKIAWEVLDEGRTVIDLLQECAQSPLWFVPILENQSAPEFDEADFEEGMKQRLQWKTIDECETACKKHSEQLYGVIKNIPDSDLEIEMQLPFGEGFVASIADIAIFHY